MNKNTSILMLAIAGLLFSLSACNKNNNPVSKGASSPDYRVSYHVEVNDGSGVKTYDGVDKDDDGVLYGTAADGTKSAHFGVTGQAGKPDQLHMQGLIVDKPNSAATAGLMFIIMENQQLNLVAIDSSSTNQHISNLDYFPVEVQPSIGRMTFRFDFEDVAFKGISVVDSNVVEKGYTASGYILCETK